MNQKVEYLIDDPNENQMDEAESKRALASIIEPFEASMNSLQVMSNALVFKVVAACEVTTSTDEEAGRGMSLTKSDLPSTCNNEWWGFWQILQWLLDLH